MLLSEARFVLLVNGIRTSKSYEDYAIPGQKPTSCQCTKARKPNHKNPLDVYTHVDRSVWTPRKAQTGALSTQGSWDLATRVINKATVLIITYIP